MRKEYLLPVHNNRGDDQSQHGEVKLTPASPWEERDWRILTQILFVTWSILSQGWTFLSSSSSWRPPNWRPEDRTSPPRRWCTCGDHLIIIKELSSSWPELGIVLECLRRIGGDWDKGEKAGELHQPPGEWTLVSSSGSALNSALNIVF